MGTERVLVIHYLDGDVDAYLGRVEIHPMSLRGSPGTTTEYAFRVSSVGDTPIYIPLSRRGHTNRVNPKEGKLIMNLGNKASLWDGKSIPR